VSCATILVHPVTTSCDSEIHPRFVRKEKTHISREETIPSVSLVFKPSHNYLRIMAFLNLILLGIGTYLAIHFYKIYQHFVIARTIGLPIIIAPIDPYGLLSQMSHQVLSRIVKTVRLPYIGTRWLRVVDSGWNWSCDDENHQIIGRNFVLVCPTRNILCTNDERTIADVLARRKDYVKPDVYSNLDIFGRNLDTVNGEDWSRHRKITAPCFNERVSSFVWDESLRQARSMLSQWLSQPSGAVSNMVDDTRILALHVLSAAGFGISHDFHAGSRIAAEGHQLSHRDSLMTILNSFILCLILGRMDFLAKINGILPKHTQHCLLAIKEFRQYMNEMLEGERQAMKNQKGSKPNLISTLVRTSDEAKAEGLGSSSSVRLTDDEIKGNIFIFNLAGHDTTANTLAYAIALLAIHPELQDWVVEEVDAVLGSVPENEWEYENLFPKLKRTLALMVCLLPIFHAALPP
jgi:cytochrome P450